MSRLAPVVAILLASLLAGFSPRRADSFATSERGRIRAHLDSVERELRATGMAGLTLSQRAARQRALDRLHAYWVHGVFPQNTDFPHRRVPYFIDRYGTRCAMAYLIEQSGRADFVARVAATNNNARIWDLAGEPELLAWLNENGLSVAEAARIQPMYCFNDVELPCEPEPTGPATASDGYKTSTIAAVSADVAAVALNGLGSGGVSPTTAGALGVLTGAVSIAIGVPNLDESGSLGTWGWVNVGAGVVSAALGTYRLVHKPSSGAHLTIGPWLRGNRDPGFRARVTF